MAEILRGGADVVRSVGAAIAGGHTIQDKEPKYGLAVTGIVHPDRILTKGGAQPGDLLLLTKPLGTGTITTALKRGQVDPAHLDAAIASMMRLNRVASQAAQAASARSATDITGFGLIGHTSEMAEAAGVRFRIRFDALPWLPGALGYAEAWIFAGGAHNNHAFYNSLGILHAACARLAGSASCTIRRRPVGCWSRCRRIGWMPCTRSAPTRSPAWSSGM